MSDEKLDELERQIHDTIRFHREQYERAVAPLLEKLTHIESLRPRVFVMPLPTGDTSE